MSEELKTTEAKKEKKMVVQGSSDTVYGIGLFGAWAYYFGRATTFEERVKGFFKGFIWPATLVYELLQFFNKEEEE